jgi:hypothetical protein
LGPSGGWPDGLPVSFLAISRIGQKSSVPGPLAFSYHPDFQPFLLDIFYIYYSLNQCPTLFKIMSDLCLHLHYRLNNRPRSEVFVVPCLPLPGATVTLPAPDDRDGLTIEWVVQPTPARWEFCRACDEQLNTHVHLDLEMAAGQ